MLRSKGGGRCCSEPYFASTIAAGRQCRSAEAWELREVDIPKAICEAGVKAIRRGKAIWGTDNVDGIREEFTSALMAENLHEALDLPIRTERPYTDVYNKLGLNILPDDIANEISLLRADIVIYDALGEEAKPVAIVEYKIFAEGAKTMNLAADLRKADAVELRKHIPIYLAVLICEITTRPLEIRKSDLNRELGHEILFSPPEKVRDWAWCFGCWHLPFEVVAVAD